MLTELNIRLTFDKVKTKSMWLFRCDCGKEYATRLNSFRSGATTCCMECSNKTKSEKVKATAARKLNTGNPNHPLYYTWTSINKRCNNINDKDYLNYGGRGIKVCARWHNFKRFVEDMGPKPTIEHTVERKNNMGNYEPDNCCWATRTEQNNNKRTNK